jgi:hypothetical protein
MTPEELAAVLLKHPGPFFDGVHSRCGCRRIVRTAREWSEHVAEVQREAERRARTIETVDHLAELIDRYGHEIVIVDALDGACQGFYDFDPEQFPATLVWRPERDR